MSFNLNTLPLKCCDADFATNQVGADRTRVLSEVGLQPLVSRGTPHYSGTKELRALLIAPRVYGIA